MAGIFDKLVLLVVQLWTILFGSVATTVARPATSHGGDRQISPALFAELEELARLVDIAYCVGNTGVHKPFRCLNHCADFKQFELIRTWNTGPLLSDSCGYIALSHRPSAQRIIVAFRGTYSIANTIADLSVVPQVYEPYPGGSDDHDHEKPRCANCTVHTGFYTSWLNTRDIVLPVVEDALAAYPDYEIVLVGHSLGGAVAALAGLDMRARGWHPRVTTFGEPRIGNEDLVAYLNDLFDLTAGGDDDDIDDRCEDPDNWSFRRVTHINDPIPLLPLPEWGYASHAGEIFISKLSLPPDVSDVQWCSGNEDPRCISGAEESSAALAALSLQSQSPHTSRLHKLLDFIPAPFRLWELFFAHRDYFWRIGLCVPGGDPGTWRLPFSFWRRLIFN
ncbi:hypothetical protein VTN49DRAFT_3784 [Thermomyces lanuginosus]|uniref:uncharacterized protein n=1 Tax=Thermomyces lanuginosus TaxID=5541 RepID=UPI0037431A99